MLMTITRVLNFYNADIECIDSVQWLQKFVIESQILFIQNFHIKKYSFIYSFEIVDFQKYLFMNILGLFYKYSCSFK